MRIGIDTTLVHTNRLTGVERYALSLARELARLAPGEVVLFTRPDAPPALASLPVEQHVAPWRARAPVDQIWLPAAAARAHVDVLHTLAFPTPLLWRGCAAITLHDATPWLYPDTVSTGMRLYYRPLYPQAIRRAAVVFTVSESARRDLVAAAGVEPGRIRVTPNGIDEVFFRAEPPSPPPAPYLLAVGTLEPRKNLPALLEAFRLLRRDHRDLQLVLAGRQGWAKRLPLGDLAPHVRLTGSIADESLAPLYAGAACFVLPSRYEGFGLPLGEAMAAGAPCVASDIAALRELGGDSVLYAAPDDTAALARAIAEALDDRAATSDRVARARARARRFTWRACAEATLAGYREIVPSLSRAGEWR